jgi:hypothetical protein
MEKKKQMDKAANGGKEVVPFKTTAIERPAKCGIENQRSATNRVSGLHFY